MIVLFLITSVLVNIALIIEVFDLNKDIIYRDNEIDRLDAVMEHNKKLNHCQVHGLYKEINRLIEEGYKGKHERN